MSSAPEFGSGFADVLGSAGRAPASCQGRCPGRLVRFATVFAQFLARAPPVRPGWTDRGSSCDGIRAVSRPAPPVRPGWTDRGSSCDGIRAVSRPATSSPMRVDQTGRVPAAAPGLPHSRSAEGHLHPSSRSLVGGAPKGARQTTGGPGQCLRHRGMPPAFPCGIPLAAFPAGPGNALRLEPARRHRDGRLGYTRPHDRDDARDLRPRECVSPEQVEPRDCWLMPAARRPPE
jgi:hypothetical protein